MASKSKSKSRSKTTSKSKSYNSSLAKLLNNPVFKNKYVLYFVAILVFIQMITYLLNHKFSAIVFFYILTLIVFQFNKNMTIVLGVPAILTFLVNKLMYRNTVEGLENKEDSEDTVEIEESNDDDVEDMGEDMTDDMGEDIADDMGEDMNDMDDTGEDMDEDKPKKTQMNNKAIEKLLQNSLNDKPNKSNKSGMHNIKKNPGLYTLPSKEAIQKQSRKVDKIEEAYDNLEKVIGKDGIKSISSNTKELVAQQKELVSGLKEMTPALDQAMSALGKVDMSKLLGIFNNFAPSK